MHRIRRAWKWAAKQQLVSATTYHSLLTVDALKAGRTDAKESKPVKPVPEALVNAVQAHVAPQVWSMIQLQLLTGARPGEVCIMRGCDLDTSGRVWTYTPKEHKTQHHGHQREIYIGPAAQAVLKPWLKLDTQAYLFSPAEAEAGRQQRRRKQRATPLYPSHVQQSTS